MKNIGPILEGFHPNFKSSDVGYYTGYLGVTVGLEFIPQLRPIKIIKTLKGKEWPPILKKLFGYKDKWCNIGGTVASINSINIASKGCKRLDNNIGDAISKVIKIKVTAKGRQHVMDRHFRNGKESSGKSLFDDTTSLDGLVNKSSNIPSFQQGHGTLKRVVQSVDEIGFDANTGSRTKIYTIISDVDGNLITAFPGQ